MNLKCIIFVVLASFAVFFCTKAAPASGPATTQSGDERSVYLSFSGGGFHSHSALSGFTAGLLGESDDTSLSEVFSNVRMITANSGGTWFMTQLAYSSHFENAIANRNTRVGNWGGSNGYIGEMQTVMPGTPDDLCDSAGDNSAMDFICGLLGVGASMELFTAYEWNWHSITSDVVFGAWDMDDEPSLRGARNIR